MERDFVNNNALDAELFTDRFIMESDNLLPENETSKTLESTFSSQIRDEQIEGIKEVQMPNLNSNFDNPRKVNEGEDSNSNPTNMVSEDCNPVSSKSDINISVSNLTSNTNQLISKSNDESAPEDMETSNLSNDDEETNCEEESSGREESNGKEESNNKEEGHGEELNDREETIISNLMNTTEIKDEMSNNIESTNWEAISNSPIISNMKEGDINTNSVQVAEHSNEMISDTGNSNTEEVLLSVTVEYGDTQEGDVSGGCLSEDTLDDGLSEDTLDDGLSEDTLDEEDICCTNCNILSTSELETKFQCPLIIAMCIFKNDSVLRLEQDGQKISKVNKVGNVTETINLDFEACDITLTNSGDILLANYHDECIMKFSIDGITSDFIKIQGRRPMALDVDTNSGELWVACVEQGDNSNYTSSARRYYHDGTLLQIIYFHDNSSSHYPMKISVCPKNGDVAVAETQVEEKERMMVTVLNAWGTEKWEYPRDRSFNVEDAAFDCEGHLLATVPRDRGLHLVGEQGTLLSVIYQSCDSIPQIITPSFDGKIWIWCQDNEDEGFEIRVIKYLEIKNV